MYTYVVSIQTMISEKHANDKDHYDEEDEIDITYHLKRMCFVALSVEKALEKAKTFDFEEPVEWRDYISKESIIENFEMGRRIRPDIVTITDDIGYILETPRRIRAFITITQVPLLD